MPTTIPAAPGYFIVWGNPGRGDGYDRTPVIAWDASSNSPVPLHLDHGLDEALLCPDGSVNSLHDGKWWPDTKAWLDELPPLPWEKTS